MEFQRTVVQLRQQMVELSQQMDNVTAEVMDNVGGIIKKHQERQNKKNRETDVTMKWLMEQDPNTGEKYVEFDNDSWKKCPDRCAWQVCVLVSIL